MNSYLISYDLIAPGRNYQPVYDYMKGFSDHMKPLQTVYLVYTSKSAKQIRDDLRTLVDANDKIIVIQISTTTWATYNLPNTSKWLESH